MSTCLLLATQFLAVILTLGCGASAEQGLAGTRTGVPSRASSASTAHTTPPSSPRSALSSPKSTAQDTPVCSVTVLATYPHDPAAFTQGLLWSDGALYEGTGQYNGLSSVRRVTLATGVVEQIKPLENQYFGEGLALVGSHLYQLTWLNGVALVHDKASFAQVDSFSYAGQGWGLTFDGEQLIMSDGSATLRFREASTFEVVRELEVFDHLGPVDMLNELEMVKGEIYANIWQENYLVRIDPGSGRVISRIDLSGVHTPTGSEDVLNGIAYDPATDRLFVTGKLWSSLYEIELVDCPDYFVFRDGFESGDTTMWSETSL